MLKLEQMSLMSVSQKEMARLVGGTVNGTVDIPPAPITNPDFPGNGG